MAEPGPKRTAIVTGAGRGIGRAIAIGLGHAGFNVVVNYHSNQASASVCAQAVGESGGQPLLVQADIGDSRQHARLLGATLEAFGRLDLLVNNAGIAPRVRKDILEVEDASNFDEMITTNLRGPYLLTAQVARHMVAQVKQDQQARGDHPRPMIVNITSLSAYTASVNRPEYCISKAGLSMMTQLFATRLAEFGILVYELRPGIIATDMTAGEAVKARYDRMILEEGLLPIRRWGQPEDVAQAVVALANGALPYSTGQVIDVDGGFHLRRL